jgi:hypothetical protein
VIFSSGPLLLKLIALPPKIVAFIIEARLYTYPKLSIPDPDGPIGPAGPGGPEGPIGPTGPL